MVNYYYNLNILFSITDTMRFISATNLLQLITVIEYIISIVSIILFIVIPVLILNKQLQAK